MFRKADQKHENNAIKHTVLDGQFDDMDQILN